MSDLLCEDGGDENEAQNEGDFDCMHSGDHCRLCIAAALAEEDFGEYACCRQNDGGYLTNTSISWEGWYLDYLIRRDRTEGVFILNAGTKKEIVIPTERDLYFDEHKIAGLMEMVNWMTRDEMHNFYRTEIWFNKAFDSIVVIDDVMGTFIAPATNEAEACAIIERIPLYLKDWED